MQRLLCAVVLLVAPLLYGCGEGNVNTTTTTDTTQAKQAAAQMPPPPGMAPAGKK